MTARAAARPPLTPPGPRLCSVYPGNVSAVCPVEYRSKTNFALMISKSRLLSTVAHQCLAYTSMHLRAFIVPQTSPGFRIGFSITLKTWLSRWVDGNQERTHCGAKECANYVRFPSFSGLIRTADR